MRAKDRNETKRIAKRHRSAPKIVNAASIPDKGTDDAYGNPFLGLPREKIANNAISNAELGPNSVLNGNIGEQINATHLPNLVGMDGDLPLDRTTGQLPASRISGNLPMSQVSGNLDGGRLQRKSVPSSALHGVHGSKLTGNSSIPWKLIDVSGVVFTHRLEKRLAEERRKSDRKYARKTQ